MIMTYLLFCVHVKRFTIENNKRKEYSLKGFKIYTVSFIRTVVGGNENETKQKCSLHDSNCIIDCY